MKIIDCFIFYNELEIINYRLTILAPIVDYFVIVEAKYTHSGKPKELFFENNKHLFENFQHQIIHIVLDDFPYKYPNINYELQQQWVNENYHRNGILLGLNKIDLYDDDILIISDADEIPDPNLLNEIKAKKVQISIHSLIQDFYYYNLNSFKGKWWLSCILSFQKYKEINVTIQQLRMNTLDKHYPCLEKGGWHLSFFGNSNFIKNKIENYAHQEYNKEEYTNVEHINECLKHKIDVYNREEDIQIISIKDNNYLPPQYDQLLKNYYSMENKVKVIFIAHDNDSISFIMHYLENPNFYCIVVGNNAIDKKYLNNVKLIFARNYEFNIESEYRLLTFTAWYLISKNNLFMDDDYLCLFEYDFVIKDIFNDQIQQAIKTNNSVYSFMQAESSVFDCVQECVVRNFVKNKKFSSDFNFDFSWNHTTNQCIKRNLLNEFVDWYYPDCLNIKIQDSKQFSHYHERLFAIYLKYKNIVYNLLDIPFEHISCKSHQDYK